ILAKETFGSLVFTLFPGAASVLLVPLIVPGGPLGMLALAYSSAAERFGADTISLAESLAEHVALAVQNAQEFALVQARAQAYERGLGAVQRAAAAITSTLRLSEVSEQIVSLIYTVLKAQAVWIMVYDEGAYR